MTKAELEQRLTDKQSECIEWVLRHDAVAAERDALQRKYFGLLGGTPIMPCKPPPVWLRLAAIVTLAFIAGDTLASLVAGVW